VAPADVDGDGDLDFAAIGFYVVYNVSAEDRLVLFINDGPDPGGGWLFTHQELALGSLSAGASDLAWADFDSDGDDDLAVASDGQTVVYRNDSGLLTQLDSPLPDYWEDSSYTGAYDLRSLTWADADNDGDPDLLIPSVFDPDTSSRRTVLMRNDGASGGSWLFTDTAATIDATVHAQSAWADDDADGDLDLFLANVDPYTATGFVRRFGNDGGIFTAGDLLAIRVEYGLADWGDFDGDGDLDILVAGNIQEAGGPRHTVLRVYRNGWSYTETTSSTPPTDWLDPTPRPGPTTTRRRRRPLITGNFVGAVDIEGKSDIWEQRWRDLHGARRRPARADFCRSGAAGPSRGSTSTATAIRPPSPAPTTSLAATAVEARMHLYRNDAGPDNSAHRAHRPDSVPAGRRSSCREPGHR
jgi:hypothetical protein